MKKYKITIPATFYGDEIYYVNADNEEEAMDLVTNYVSSEDLLSKGIIDTDTHVEGTEDTFDEDAEIIEIV